MRQAFLQNIGAQKGDFGKIKKHPTKQPAPGNGRGQGLQKGARPPLYELSGKCPYCYYNTLMRADSKGIFAAGVSERAGDYYL